MVLRNSHRVVDVRFASVESVPSCGLAAGLTSHANSQDTKVRNRDDRCAVFDAHPTRIISSRDEFARILKSRREQVGISLAAQAEHLGRTKSKYFLYEKGKVLRVQTGLVQRLSYDFNIRFNFLPFTGPPLSDRDDIERDLIKRCLTLGLDPYEEEFERYVGMDFECLRAAIVSDDVLAADIFDLLTDKFHMRIFPEPVEKELGETVEEAEAFRTYVLELCEVWQMTQTEMADLFGFHRDTLGEFFDNPLVDRKARRVLAEYLGYTIPEPHQYTQETLPRLPGYYYLDQSLYEAIQEQIAALGWTHNKLCDEVGISRANYHPIWAYLQEPFDLSSPGIRSRQTLEKICKFLKIKIHRPKTLSIQEYELKDKDTDINELCACIRGRRAGLRMSRQEVVRAIGKKKIIATIDDIEQGRIHSRNFHVFEDVLEFFRIKFDPFQNLEPICLEHLPSADELSHVLKNQLEQVFVSRDKLERLAGIDKQELVYILAGRRATSRPSVRRVCRILKVHLPAQTDEEKWVQYLDEACFENEISANQLCADVGIDDEQFYRIKRGEFSLSEEIITAINYRISSDHITKDSLAKYQTKEAWAEELSRRIELTGHTVQSLSSHLGIDSRKLRWILKGNFTWNDAEFTDILAPFFRLYNRVLVQIILEDYKGDEITLQIETGIPLALIADEGFYRFYNINGSGERTRINKKRWQYLIDEFHGKRASESVKEFLVMTGGAVADIKNAPLEHIFYLYSIGDYQSAAIYIKMQNEIDVEGFLVAYAVWVKETYNIKVNGDEKNSIPGKFFAVRYAPDLLYAHIADLN